MYLSAFERWIHYFFFVSNFNTWGLVYIGDKANSCCYDVFYAAKLPSDDILMIATIIQLANWAFFTRGICSWYCTLMMGASSKYWQSKISYSVTIIYMNRAGVPWFEGFGGAHFKFLMWIQLSAEVIWFCLSLLRSIKTFACMFLSFQCDALELCMVVS